MEGCSYFCIKTILNIVPDVIHSFPFAQKKALIIIPVDYLSLSLFLLSYNRPDLRVDSESVVIYLI